MRELRILDAAALRTEAAYRIYRACMYRPTREKYDARTDELLRGRVYGCMRDGALVGILALSLPEDGTAEIVGIAVAEDARGQGIGAWLIAQAARAEGLKRLMAETDDEAVGFYRRCGFHATRLERSYDGTAVTRWRCVWDADAPAR